MALPFGLLDMNDACNRALEYEEEQDDQIVDEESKPEDEFVLRLAPALKTSVKQDGRLNVSKLIICTDFVSSGFTDAYLLSQGASKTGLVCGPTIGKEENSVKQDSFWDKSCFCYSLSGCSDVLVCQLKSSIESKFFFTWVEKIFSRINPSHVIVLSSILCCNLQLATEKDVSDILRQLKTDSFNLKSEVFPLEKPNLIRDLAATVMTYCQVHDIAAILYLLGTEGHAFDVSAVKSFKRILKDEVFQSVPQGSEVQIKEILKKLCDLRVPDKGVYI